eukprot:m.230081 g.230081  ORF g.230081 m.230081 type:complete len:179 (+) comp40053_c0_seq6:108-644(+)
MEMPCHAFLFALNITHIFVFLTVVFQGVSSQTDPCTARNPEEFDGFSSSTGITWLNTPYNFHVNPGSKAGLSLGFIKAERAGSTLFYSTASNPQFVLDVNGLTGEITLENDIDERAAALGTNQFCASFFAFTGSISSQIGVGLYRIVDENYNSPSFSIFSFSSRRHSNGNHYFVDFSN